MTCIIPKYADELLDLLVDIVEDYDRVIHILYELMNNYVPSEKLDNFCSLIISNYDGENTEESLNFRINVDNSITVTLI